MKKKEENKEISFEERSKVSFKETLKAAIGWGIGLSSYIGIACLMPDPTILAMMTTFSLSLVAGY